MIDVVIADDHPVVRAGIRALLATAEDVRIVAEVGTAEEAVEAAASRPDVILLDLQFGSTMTGVDAARRIRAQAAAPHVLVLTNYDSDGDILGAVEAGASGYLLKDAPPDQLLAAIRAAAAGESALAPAIAGRLMARMRSPHTALSARELEVLQLVADGASNDAVARRLTISQATVKSHLVHVFTKLQVGSRTEAIAEARAAGLLR